MSSTRIIELVRSWGSLIRYYQAAIVNTLFGYALYSVFVAAGVNIYVAQLLAHVLGVIFNYFTYSRYAFRDNSASKLRFALAYGGNYFIGLAMLAAASAVVKSAYLAGFIALVGVSLINYFVLRNLVFTKRAAEAEA
ncbi:MAG TPA: GtrA family protein [Sphingomicrobium sp.]